MTKVKICGITRMQDALYAAKIGVDFLGFIFAESPRRITARQGRDMARKLPCSIKTVGVFVNENLETIREVSYGVGLHMVQLHGEESPDFYRALELPVIKVFHTKGTETVDEISVCPADFILLEPYVPGMKGGTGREADWQMAADIIHSFPEKKIFLAGGLGPENVSAAVHKVKPFAVDGNSQLEERPGIKNTKLMKRFIQEVKGA